MPPQTRSRTGGKAPPSRVYEATPAAHQVTFPPRQRIVRTYGRHSLPPPRSLADRFRQQTLTQVGNFQPSPSAELELGDDGDEDEDEEQTKMPAPKSKSASKAKPKPKAKAKQEPKSKRRKTMGDAPNSSSFHTQTITQLLSWTDKVEKAEKDEELRINDSQEQGDAEDEAGYDPRVWDFDFVETPELPSLKKKEVPKKKATKAAQPPSMPPPPQTPSKRILEIPSSQPTPFTPLLGYSPIGPARSPLKDKSTNTNAPAPTIESSSKRPRNLIIQDSFSPGGGLVSSSSLAELSSEQERSSQKRKREPLAEIPLESLDLGRHTSEVGETTPTPGVSKIEDREIPDSDDDLTSIHSTPFATPHKLAVSTEDPGSGSQAGVADTPSVGEQATPVGNAPTEQSVPSSSNASNKENATPTPKVRNSQKLASQRMSSQRASSQRISKFSSRKVSSPRPLSRSRSVQKLASHIQASDVISREEAAETAQADKSSSPLSELEERLITSEEVETTVETAVGSTVKTVQEVRSSSPLSELDDDLTASENSEDERSGTPTPTGPQTKSLHQIKDENAVIVLSSSPSLPRLPQANDSTAKVLTPILKRGRDHGSSVTQTAKRRTKDGTPIHHSSTDFSGDVPSTPTPARAKRVQFQKPPPPTADDDEEEEVYKETPQKAHKKPSPLTQRHTQAGSPFYSQGWESQRLPLDVIRSLGPQTDRSDIVIHIDSGMVRQVINGIQRHMFHKYKLPTQVARVWMYTSLPVEQVKYMAQLGPAQSPGEIDDHTEANKEFNSGTSEFKYAYEVIQGYQLNDPVLKDEMHVRAGIKAPPAKWHYLAPFHVGNLCGNLRRALFNEWEHESLRDGLQEEVPAAERPGSLTISQENNLLENQLHSDIVQQTKRSQHVAEPQEEDIDDDEVIPESPGQPVLPRKPTPKTTPRATEPEFARPSTSRSSQRIRSQQQRMEQMRSTPPTVRRTTTTTTTTTATVTAAAAAHFVRPSQATTASDISQDSSPFPSPSKSLAQASVPRPTMPAPSSDWSLPELDDEMANDDSLQLPQNMGSSSQAYLLGPDSLLADSEHVRAPPEIIFDSEDDE
ncbi:hypothetical protein QBC35DRAFT_488513 [Podospora australis]|uniref:Uncharacterized protein n=1 Tax=Podospora australis TaxID=1536484 RepID=A0AAN7ALB4_9PEZI|nr:hypothetical protein QBC35DRAFT_488513 [Podospora australis]